MSSDTAGGQPEGSMREGGATTEATVLLERLQAGDTAAVDRLLPIVHDELHGLAARLMQGERPDHTLQATALVNEAYLRLVDQTRVRWQGRTHFFAVAATMLRRILVDHARAHRSAKRGGAAHELQLEDVEPVAPGHDEVDVLALDEALQELAKLDPRQARIVELRFFAGLGIDDIARSLGVSPRTVKGDWRVARAWLHARLDSHGP